MTVIKKRRRFSVAEKVEILENIDQLDSRAEVAEYLKANHLFSSQVSVWRKSLREGKFDEEVKRGRKSLLVDGEQAAIAAIIQKRGELQREIEAAEKIMEAQRNLLAVLAAASNH